MKRCGKDDIASLSAADTDGVQSLLLRAPRGPVVRHLLLRVPEGRGVDARGLLTEAGRISFGIPADPGALVCSIGFTFAGLEALHLPREYLRVFQRFAPSFREGAVRRSAALGDSGASSAAGWRPEFRHEHAHVVVSWHGSRVLVNKACQELQSQWRKLSPRPPVSKSLRGERLGAPAGKSGEWAHFGFRDDVTDIAIDREQRSVVAPDLRFHAPGAVLLGWMDDEGLNRFSLTQAPEKVRGFFRGSSFGILRPALQEIAAFEAQVAQWQSQLSAMFEPEGSSRTAAKEPLRPAQDWFGVDPDFAKAKLCGRWPDGHPVREGETRPPKALPNPPVADLQLKLHRQDDDGRYENLDPDGTGCPFGSHVRRMQGSPDRQGRMLLRPLLRRSVPFGSATWDKAPTDDERRGHISHFFCASIENQFEHLLGQWGSRPPFGAAAGDDALDPLMGPHDGQRTGLLIPLDGKKTQRLTGFRAWTTTLGMAYAWYPGADAREMLFADDFVPVELAGPWL